MAYITNDGSRLIERARTEGKYIVFGSVRMNTTYKSDPYSLVQKDDEWFGENHGSVVGCISHVSVDDVSQVCDSKLAVQCNDNSVSWKSIGIYAHLDGEVDELLFACESIENGEYKDVTIVELPVTLDGVVSDFGLSEGGSGGSGGGEVPENMMTTNTDQIGMSGRKEWLYETFYGSGSIDNPKRDDRKTSSFATIGCYDGNPQEDLISVSSFPQYYNGNEWLSGQGSEVSLTTRGSLRLNSGDTYDDVEHVFRSGESLTITPNDVQYENQTNETFSASWNDIIHAANSGGGGGEVPANMMTTDTVQTDLTGSKTWKHKTYDGMASAESPDVGDVLNVSIAEIGRLEDGLSPLGCSNSKLYYNGSKWLESRASYAQLLPRGVLQLSAGSTFDGQYFVSEPSVEITPNGVNYTPQDFETVSASWNDIINAANSGEGGSGEVPANMMTTDTEQTGLTGMKQWSWENYLGDLGSLDNPRDGDRKSSEQFSINSIEGENRIHLDFYSEKFTYYDKDRVWHSDESSRLKIMPDKVHYNGSFASWSDIINAAKVEQGFDHARIRQREDGTIEIDGEQVTPNSEIKIGVYVIAVIDSNSKIASVRSTGGVLDVSVAVIESSTAHRVSGIISGNAGLSFDSPITLAEGQELYIHWARYE